MLNSTIDGRLKGLELRIQGRPKPPELKGIPVGKRSPQAMEAENRMKEVYKVSGKLNVNGTEYRSHIDDLQHVGELGSGTCGHVVKMLHKPSAAVIAVKQMRRSGNAEDTKRILMDLDVVVRSHDCPYIVKCLGCFVTDADVWICMELMATCFDKLIKRLPTPVPEPILGKVTVATVNALSYLKNSHGVIHRDVKPSNILLDERGNVKLCDFGISGRLVDSKAKTRSAGCAAYMAPERISPPDPAKPAYDIRADVWSLGISLVELATGVFPYSDCQSDFEVLTKVVQCDPPRLPENRGFSADFKNFVSQCLTKNYSHRPKYNKLLEHPFVVKASKSQVSVGDWYATLPLSNQGTPSKNPSTIASGYPIGFPVTTSAVFQIGAPVSNGAESPKENFVSAQHWIDQVTPQPQRAHWATNTFANAGGSSSQPASLEADYSPFPRRRTLEACASPPPAPPARRVSADNRWRNSPASSGNSSPLVLQRFHHQSQQRRSRADLHCTPRHRSVSREHSSGRSPEPPPRTGRLHFPHHLLSHEANGSTEMEPPPLHERLHGPSPLLLNDRLSEGRSQSLSRADFRNGFRPEMPPPPPPTSTPHKHPIDEQSWLHSLAGLVKRRLSGYVKWQRPQRPQHSHASRCAGVQGSSWSVPASPLPPRAPPRPLD